MSLRSFSRIVQPIVCLIAAAVVLSGCTAQSVRDYNSYVATNSPLAMSGQMQWSDYLKGVYTKLAALPDSPRKAFNMQGINHLIELALDMEVGKIPKGKFESAMRDFVAKDAAMRAEAQQEQQRRNTEVMAQQSAAWDRYAKGPAAVYSQTQAQQPIYTSAKTINCTTTTTGGIVANTSCTEQ